MLLESVIASNALCCRLFTGAYAPTLLAPGEDSDTLVRVGTINH